VIWVIGVSMIALAALIGRPLRLIVMVSVTVIALHNLLDAVRVAPMQPPGFQASIWMVLHQPGVIFFTPTVYGLMLYPLIPWIGVSAAGYAFGAFYQLEAELRRRIIFKLGATLLASFVPLFFYVGQWVTVHILSTLAGYLAGQPIGWLFLSPLNRP